MNNLILGSMLMSMGLTFILIANISLVIISIYLINKTWYYETKIKNNNTTNI